MRGPRNPKPHDIDLPIVDIIELMNQLGFTTWASCCGYDYPAQGIKDHGQAYVNFRAKFYNVVQLRKAVHGYWRLVYEGGDEWQIEHGACEHVWDDPHYIRGCKWAWGELRRALRAMER